MKQPFILQLPSQYHHLCFFFFIFFKPGPATLTQRKRTSASTKSSKDRNQETPSVTTKGWSTQDLWKDTALGDGEVVTLMCISEAPVPCCWESWVEQSFFLSFFFFAVLHRSLQTLRSQSKYCETLHNATRDSKKQAGPQNGALGVVEEYVHSCYFGV